MSRAWVTPAVLLLAAACAGTRDPVSDRNALPVWSYDSALVFPSGGSLMRPEDGVALADGRLVVADQAYGLRLVELNGRSASFGGMRQAGYSHQPPAHPGGANGVSLEPDGTHLLVADVFGAAIYRVEVSTGKTEKVYQHRYGINTAVRDSHGAIWFTQSAQNTPAEGEPRLWAAVDVQRPEGALYRLGMTGGQLATTAELIADSLFFANGLVLDEPHGHLYLAETTGGRILRFGVDFAQGAARDRMVFADSVAADNLELDRDGNLWAAVPLGNQVLIINPRTGARHSAFRAITPAQQDIVAEFTRRGQAGTSRMELFTPALWAPLPAPITGIILGAPGDPVYFTGLGNTLLRLPR